MPVSVKKIADMPASGPGPKPRVKNSAQISMSTERRKSKKRLNTWLASRFGVMLRAARKASGKATIEREQRADEGHDDGLQQLRPDVAVLPLRGCSRSCRTASCEVRFAFDDGRAAEDQAEHFASRPAEHRRGPRHRLLAEETQDRGPAGEPALYYCGARRASRAGQRGRAVNPLALPSQVRILPPPCHLRRRRPGPPAGCRRVVGRRSARRPAARRPADGVAVGPERGRLAELRRPVARRKRGRVRLASGRGGDLDIVEGRRVTQRFGSKR